MKSIAAPADAAVSRHKYLLYSIGRNPAESFKQNRAITLLDDDSTTLSIQVLQEFYVQATRSTRCDAISHELAAGLIESWTRFRIQDMNIEVLKIALEIRRTHHSSFWDCAIIAAALKAGCDRLYTEDLTHGQVIRGLTVIDPFR